MNDPDKSTYPGGSFGVQAKQSQGIAGLNYWSFETNLAATYLHSEKGFEISASFGHLYNTENEDTDYHTGQELHVEYMLNQFLSETFAIGLQGFYYKQLTSDSGSGAILDDFKGEAAGSRTFLKLDRRRTGDFDGMIETAG